MEGNSNWEVCMCGFLRRQQQKNRRYRRGDAALLVEAKKGWEIAREVKNA